MDERDIRVTTAREAKDRVMAGRTICPTDDANAGQLPVSRLSMR